MRLVHRSNFRDHGHGRTAVRPYADAAHATYAKRRRRRRRSPASQRRIALLIIATGAVVAGSGAAIRGGATDLLEGFGLIAALAGAALEVRTALLFFQATPRAARRRALLLAIVGLLAALVGCVLASTVFDRDAASPLAGGATAVLTGGVGCGLAGLVSLLWFYGGDYAARRIERMSDEEW